MQLTMMGKLRMFKQLSRESKAVCWLVWNGTWLSNVSTHITGRTLPSLSFAVFDVVSCWGKQELPAVDGLVNVHKLAFPESFELPGEQDQQETCSELARFGIFSFDFDSWVHLRDGYLLIWQKAWEIVEPATDQGTVPFFSFTENVSQD